MATVVAALLLVGAVWVHGAGHSAVMRDLGIGRGLVRYGAPFGPRIVRRPTPGRPWPVVITPWLVTWAVTPAAAGDVAETLPYASAALYASGGVLASLAAGCWLICGWSLLGGSLLPALGWGTAGGLLWGGRRAAAGLLTISAAGVLLGTEIAALGGGLHGGGVHGLAALAAVHSFRGAMYAGGVYCLCIGLFSMLPIPRLDGARMMTTALGVWEGTRSQSAYETVRGLVLGAVVVVAVGASVLGVVG